MYSIDAEKISALLAECAEACILPRFRLLQEHEIAQKSGPRDLVTHADIEAEAYLSGVLPDCLPGSIVVGEEGVSRGEISIGMLAGMDRDIWVVDPVDGTYNFVHGDERFAVMLALMRDGRTRMGWIYDAPRKRMFMAEEGGGAWEGGRRLHVRRSPEKLEDMTVYANPRFASKPLRPSLEEAASRFGRCLTLRSAAHEYIGLLTGEADAAVYSRMKPWDHLAGTLAVREADGHVAKMDGSPYSPLDEQGGLIAATGQSSWIKIRNAI